jgi:chromosome segregation ATPase
LDKAKDEAAVSSQSTAERTNLELQQRQDLLEQVQGQLAISKEDKQLLQEQHDAEQRAADDRLILLKQLLDNIHQAQADEIQDLNVSLSQLQVVLDETKAENQQLRQVRDSLQGIDQEMTQVIQSLEVQLPEMQEQHGALQVELASQKARTEGLVNELASCRTREASLQQKLGQECEHSPGAKNQEALYQERLDTLESELAEVIMSNRKDVARFQRVIADLEERLTERHNLLQQGDDQQQQLVDRRCESKDDQDPLQKHQHHADDCDACITEKDLMGDEMIELQVSIRLAEGGS